MGDWGEQEFGRALFGEWELDRRKIKTKLK